MIPERVLEGSETILVGPFVVWMASPGYNQIVINYRDADGKETSLAAVDDYYTRENQDLAPEGVVATVYCNVPERGYLGEDNPEIGHLLVQDLTDE